MKNILITGGAGFIGSNLCAKLLEDENNFVYCVDNLLTGRQKNIANLYEYPYGNKFIFNSSDILDETAVFFNFIEKAKTHESEIYHLACPASPPKYQHDPIATMMINVVGTRNILNLARKTNSKILFTSTSEIYGDPLEHPQKESYRGNVNPTGPRSCYDEGKRAAECLVYDYQRRFEMEVRVARIFNTYGPNMDLDDGRVVTNFIKQALCGQPVTIYGSGNQTRSLCYIDDQVDGLMKLMASNYSNPVNIGNPHELTINNLAETILSLLDIPAWLSEYRDLPEDDPQRRQPDITLARTEIGWEPKVSLIQGLEKTIEYAKLELQNT